MRLVSEKPASVDRYCISGLDSFGAAAHFVESALREICILCKREGPVVAATAMPVP